MAFGPLAGLMVLSLMAASPLLQAEPSQRALLTIREGTTTILVQEVSLPSSPARPTPTWFRASRGLGAGEEAMVEGQLTWLSSNRFQVNGWCLKTTKTGGRFPSTSTQKLPFYGQGSGPRWQVPVCNRGMLEIHGPARP